ncbi:putative ceramide glucosyltransferase [Talaromyces proteolyticus]|uniref:Ceramide glucosyltransferase n=1 Tax=Talaromyces proteolyticus TaxID=1131652 RepID=A0AAD4KXC3_9EURO|nr:putative ceramide glucosyltransferase [Talaromyces proteolyticus]KAH8702234.1 putative ceramide glucosyltransferase [Talaromyces proteolyticus]
MLANPLGSVVVLQRAAGAFSCLSVPWLVDSLGWIGLIWYLFVVAVCTLGYFQIWRYYSHAPRKSVSASSSDAPHVTVVRPVKGVEPYLYECLASTLRQDYPSDKLTVYICVSTRKDPAFPILEKVVQDFAACDVRVLVEEEDPLLQDGSSYPLGPNPKIRNMSRAYREAKGDLLWIIDCNVWVGKGACGRMVDKLCGYDLKDGRKYKFVHHLPVAVDVDAEDALADEARPMLANGNASYKVETNSLLGIGGGRLEELFLSSSHAKMYTAINTVLIAPCIVGKSNMFRRSHLDYLTVPKPGDTQPRNPGIDYVSDHLCEDHIIGDWLWKNKVREEAELGVRLGKHAMVFGDLAFQPVASMSVKAYIARRVRWLRVRKYTVLAATLVEPGTESIVCSSFGAYGISTVVAKMLDDRGIALGSQLGTWSSFFLLWASSIILWCLIDWTLYLRLHSSATIEIDAHTPPFARPSPQSEKTRRPFTHWLAAWIGRESLAFPIWFWAVYGGSTVVWRNRAFRVSLWDTKAREAGKELRVVDSSYSNGSPTKSNGNKVRTD